MGTAGRVAQLIHVGAKNERKQSEPDSYSPQMVRRENARLFPMRKRRAERLGVQEDVKRREHECDRAEQLDQHVQ
jgi:hypothetical protein